MCYVIVTVCQYKYIEKSHSLMVTCVVTPQINILQNAYVYHSSDTVLDTAYYTQEILLSSTGEYYLGSTKSDKYGSTSTESEKYQCDYILDPFTTVVSTESYKYHIASSAFDWYCV